jgi:hypothetical protein
MELILIIALFFMTFFHDIFGFFFEKIGLLEIKKLEREITFNKL